MCQKKIVFQNFARVKVPNASPVTKFTIHKAKQLRVFVDMLKAVKYCLFTVKQNKIGFQV